MISHMLNEPVMIATAIRMTLFAVMAFGFKMTIEQLGAVMAAVEAILALVNRALVTPNQLAEARVAAGGSPTVPRDGERAELRAAAAAENLREQGGDR